MTAGTVDTAASTADPDGAVGSGISAPMVAALESAWAAIRARNPELPPVVIVLGAGSGERGGLRLGHFAALRWGPAEVGIDVDAGQADGSGARLAEVFVGGEGLARGAVDVFGTLLHEAAHALAHVRGVQDTSRQGRWHNARFKAIATEVGIAVEKDPRLGWSPTTVPDTTRETYRDVIGELARALRMRRASEPCGGAARPKKPGPPACVRVRAPDPGRGVGARGRADRLRRLRGRVPARGTHRHPRRRRPGRHRRRYGRWRGERMNPADAATATTRDVVQDNRSVEGRPGDGFLAEVSRRAALTAHQQKAGEDTMLGRPDDGWRARAACRTSDPEVFFPVAEDGPELEQAVARAKRICAGCPVLAECRAWAIEALSHGIAGAMTEHERSDARRARPARSVSACRASTTRVPIGAQRLPRRLRGPVIAAGKAALADGVPRDQVAAEFAVTRRTVDRWAAAQQGSTTTTAAAAVSGGDR